MPDQDSSSDIRLFVDAPLKAEADITLDPGQSHYLVTVMRRGAGDRLAVFNGRDGQWSAELTSAHRKRAEIRLLTRDRPQTAEPDLWFAFAPVKKARIDFIAEKATELGASRLIPVFTDNTAVSRVNKSRLAAHAIEAAEQCGRLTVPVVDAPTGLADLLSAWPAGRRLLFCDEQGRASPAASALAGQGEDPGPWGIVVGPEGGFSADECARIRAHPATVPVSLGPRILRAETAGLAALALWQAHLGDWY